MTHLILIERLEETGGLVGHEPKGEGRMRLEQNSRKLTK
jgi:hypothetical protein